MLLRGSIGPTTERRGGKRRGVGAFGRVRGLGRLRSFMGSIGSGATGGARLRMRGLVRRSGTIGAENLGGVCEVAGEVSDHWGDELPELALAGNRRADTTGAVTGASC